MVPTSYASYFTATAGAAGVIIGLLFVAVSLRADTVFGPDAPPRGRVLAMSSFSALANAFFLSILAIVPQVNVGYPAIVLAVVSLWNTARLHRELLGNDPQYVTLLVSLAAYFSELGLGIALLVRPHSTSLVNLLRYVVVAEFVAALSRAWHLVQGAHLQSSPPTVRPD